MRQGTALFILWLVSALPALAHPPVQLSPQSAEGVAQDVKAFRRAVADAILAKNASVLRRSYAESYSHTQADGTVLGRDRAIAEALSGAPTFETSPVETLSIHVLAGGWVAIATGISPFLAPGEVKPHTLHWTVTYARNQDGWQIAASHVTRGREWTK
jgi:ketosteroid isomerase-like protein